MAGQDCPFGIVTKVYKEYILFIFSTLELYDVGEICLILTASEVVGYAPSLHFLIYAVNRLGHRLY